MPLQVYVAPVLALLHADILSVVLKFVPFALSTAFSVLGIAPIAALYAFLLYQAPRVSVSIVLHWPLVQTVVCLLVSFARLLFPPLAELTPVVLYVAGAVRAALIAPEFLYWVWPERLRPYLLLFGPFVTVVVAFRAKTPWAVQFRSLLWALQVLVVALLMPALLAPHKCGLKEWLLKESLRENRLKFRFEVVHDPCRALLEPSAPYVVVRVVVVVPVLLCLVVLRQLSFSARPLSLMAPLVQVLPPPYLAQ